MLTILANTNQLRTENQPWELGNFLDSLLNFLEIYHVIQNIFYWSLESLETKNSSKGSL